MREIKFRVPHYNHKGKFVQFSYWGRLNHCEFASPAMINTASVKKPDEQYTGLKDKNGKEIYEGSEEYSEGGKRVVSFKDGCFWLDLYYMVDGKWKLSGGTSINHYNVHRMDFTRNIHEASNG